MRYCQLTSKRFQRLGREFLWIASGQAAATLGALVGIRLLTAVLPLDIYGELALGMTLVILVNQIVFTPPAVAGLRFFAAAREAYELANFLAALRRLLAKATGVVLILALGTCLVLLLTGHVHWLWLGIAAFGFALLFGYNAVLDNIQNAALQRPVVAWHQALASWGRFLAAAGMVLWLGATSTMAMLGYVLATVLVLLSQCWFFRRTLLPTNSRVSHGTAATRHWEAQMLAYSWPFAMSGVFTWAQIASDRWALQVFASTREVGLYAALYQLGYYPITILTGLMMQLVMPILFQRAGNASDAARMLEVHTLTRRLTMTTLLLTGAATWLAFVLHRVVFTWLVAPEYRAISWLLPGMVLAGGLFATGQCAIISLLSSTETRSLLALKIVTASVGVLLNMWGAAQWGVMGVVGAGVMFSTVYMLWTLHLVRSQYNQLVDVGSTLAGKQNIL